MTPHEFARGLEEIYEGALESVILYGSGAGHDFSKTFSDYNLIVILKDVAPGELEKSNRLTRKWMRKGNPAPHFFDEHHIQTSRDVFPLEFIDIRDRHQVLMGRNPFATIVIEPVNLRHQCESELKGKLLHLRSYFNANCHRPKRIAHIMVSSFSSFNAVFRGVLTLMGQTPPQHRRDVVELLATHLDFNPGVFLDIINIRDGNISAPRRRAALESFEEYLTALASITTYVDKLGEGC
jgi:hypothetical protein